MSSPKHQRNSRQNTTDLASHLAKNKNQFADEENANNSKSTFDEYGRGAPTDRLIFGYAPSVTAEAVAFHSRFTNKQWKLERRLRYKNRCLRPRQLFLQEQAAIANGTTKKEGVLNFEPDTSAIKLRLYWIEKLEEEKKFLQGQLTSTATGTTTTTTTNKNSNNTSTKTEGGNQQQQKNNDNNSKKQASGSGKGESSFGKLLSDMFGGEYTSETAENEGGKRRQRNE